MPGGAPLRSNFNSFIEMQYLPLRPKMAQGKILPPLEAQSTEKIIANSTKRRSVLQRVKNATGNNECSSCKVLERDSSYEDIITKRGDQLINAQVKEQ
jgi:hypothetical protein